MLCKYIALCIIMITDKIINTRTFSRLIKLNRVQLRFYNSKETTEFHTAFPMIALTNDNIFIKTKVDVWWKQKDFKLSKYQIDHQIKINAAKSINDKFGYFDMSCIVSESDCISQSLERDLDNTVNDTCLITFANLSRMEPICDQVKQTIINYKNRDITNTSTEINAYNELKLKLKTLGYSNKY